MKTEEAPADQTAYSRRTMSRLHLQSFGIHTSSPSLSINFAPQRRRRLISNLRLTSMALKQFEVDVAVVGGGPGGLAAAAAITSAFGTDTTVKVRSKRHPSCRRCTRACVSVPYNRILACRFTRASSDTRYRARAS